MHRLVAMLALSVLLAGCAAPALRLDPAASGLPVLECGDACGVVLDATPGGGFEPHVAIDPLDPRHVVAATRVQGRSEGPFPYVLWFDVHSSRDGGVSWNVTRVQHTEPFLRGGNADARNVMGDPVLAFLPDGTLLLTGASLQYLALPGGGVLREVRLFVTPSADGGASFEPPVEVARSRGAMVVAGLPGSGGAAAPALVDLPDKPWLAAGPDGTALLAWSRVVGGHPESPGWRCDVMLASSNDGGRAWTTPVLVARGGCLQGPAPVVGSDSAWYVAYVDFETRRARLAASHDSGATWRVADVMPGAWMPALAVARGPDGDRLHLVASPPRGDGPEGEAPQAIAVSWSDDGGASWSEPLVLHEPGAPGRVLPSVAALADGTVLVTFAHPQPGGSSAFRAVALAPSGWRASLTVDAVAGPTSRLGDYLGLAAGPEEGFAVWSTTRDGSEYDIVGAALRLRAQG